MKYLKFYLGLSKLGGRENINVKQLSACALRSFIQGIIIGKFLKFILHLGYKKQACFALKLQMTLNFITKLTSTCSNVSLSS